MLVRQAGLPLLASRANIDALVVGEEDPAVVVAGAGFDRAGGVEAPAGLAVGGAQGDQVGGVGAEVERAVDRQRRGFEVRVELADPVFPAGRGVAGGEVAGEEGAVDAAFVVDGGGDEVRRALVAGPDVDFPEHLAVPQPDRFAVAVLVDHVGDPVVDRGRELNQRVRVDRPGLLQRRVERFLVGGEVVSALGDPAEQRPVDIVRAGGDFGGRGPGFAIVRVTAASEQEGEDQGKRGCEAHRSSHRQADTCP